jgi:hypothetical protein
MVRFLEKKLLVVDGYANGSLEEGRVILSDADLARLPGEAVESKIVQGMRIVEDNLSEAQAVQINGPVGGQDWVDVSHVAVRRCVSHDQSAQINAPMSTDAFMALLDNRVQMAKTSPYTHVQSTRQHLTRQEPASEAVDETRLIEKTRS